MKKVIMVLIVIAIIVFLIICINKKNLNFWNINQQENINFEIVFNENKGSGKNKIISKNIFVKDSYNVYSYEGNIKIKIDDVEYDFKEALLQEKITIQDIFSKAQKDVKNKISKMQAWDDGGTVIYKYETYSIIKFNTIGGCKDFYIGSPDMNYSVGE